MKNQILMLVIGILIGAIIATGVFLVLKGDTQAKGGRMDRGQMGEPPSMDGNSIDRGMRGSQADGRETQGGASSDSTSTTD